MLTGLQDSARYEIYVRLVCGNSGGVGELSDAVQLTLVDASMFYVSTWCVILLQRGICGA